MLKKLLLVIAFIMLCVSSSYSYSGGQGTESSPYIIATYEDMYQLRRDTNTYSSSDVYYKLSNDIQMTRYGWNEAIGSSSSNPFSGHFDGNDCTVHVHIRNNNDSSLFGYVSSKGTIENLYVEGQVYSFGDAAGIVHTLDGGEITNCRFSGNIYVTDLDSSDITENLNAGGIVEYMTSGTIDSCTFNGEIIIKGGIYPRAGGIVSLMHGGDITSCSITPYSKIASYAYEDEEGSAISGGISGQVNIGLDEEISGCEFRGEVIAESVNTSYAGGIVGFMRGGMLTGNTVLDDSSISSSYTAGGIAGFLRSGGSASNNHAESGSTVSADTHSAGGIIGILDLGNVLSNDSYASIEGNASCKGGIIGEVTPATSDPATGTILNNRYSGYDYGIGRDASGLPSDRGSTNVSDSELPFRITTNSELPNGKAGSQYNSVTLETDAGESADVTWTVQNIPDGLSLDVLTGTITGTPTKAGYFTFTVTAVINQSSYAQKKFVLRVYSGNEITITNEGTYNVDAGSSFSLTLETNSGSSTNTRWSLLSGDIPSGLTLTERGVLSGTPSKSGKYTFTLQAAYGYSIAQKEFTITVSPAITSPSYLPNGIKGEAYSETLSVTGVSSPKWSVVSGTLPSGLTLSTAGNIHGTPVSEGVYDFIVNVSDDAGLYARKLLRITIDSYSTLPITTASLPSGKYGEEYYAELYSSVSNAKWEITEGNLPEGLTLNSSNGLISGIPLETGTFTFTVKASYGLREGTRKFTIEIAEKEEEIISDDVKSTGSSSGGGCNMQYNLLTLIFITYFLLLSYNDRQTRGEKEQ